MERYQILSSTKRQQESALMDKLSGLQHRIDELTDESTQRRPNDRDIQAQLGDLKERIRRTKFRARALEDRESGDSWQMARISLEQALETLHEDLEQTEHNIRRR